MLSPAVDPQRFMTTPAFTLHYGDEELAVLPPHTKVVVTGNNRTRSVLVGLQGVVKKSVGLGGWHWLVLTNGVEVKLQRNALSVIEAPTRGQQGECQGLLTGAPRLGFAKRPQRKLTVDMKKLGAVSLWRYWRHYKLPIRWWGEGGVANYRLFEATAMASTSAGTTPLSAFLQGTSLESRRRLRWKGPGAARGGEGQKVPATVLSVRAKRGENSLQYRKLGDSELTISEIMLGTMTFGQQNTEKESHDMLSYAFEKGINAIDTAEAYPVPMKKETQGRTDLYIGSWMKSIPRDKVILATKVCGYSEQSAYIRDNATVLRVDAANIKESVEKSLKRLDTDYIDLLQIHWPDRYVPLFGEFLFDPSKWRPSIPFVEQLTAFQKLIDQGKVRYIGVSNETSYGVMEFVHAAKVGGLPKIVSIQNSYSLLVRCRFEVDLVEVCHPNNCNIGLLAYSPLGGGTLSGKYRHTNSEAARKGRLNLFPGYMERYNRSLAKEATELYFQLAKKHGLTPVQLALGFTRDRPFMTSSIIGATSVEQLKEDIDAFVTTARPLPPEVYEGIEDIFKRYKDPAIL